MESMQSIAAGLHSSRMFNRHSISSSNDGANQSIRSTQGFPINTPTSNGLDFNNYSRFVAETENRAVAEQSRKQDSLNRKALSSEIANLSKQNDPLSKSESMVRVYKGGHIHTIKNASAFKLGFAHSIYSNEFTINGHNWQIISYLGGETEDVADYISLFLGYVGPFQQCRANWTLRIVNQQDPSKSRTREWKRGDKYNTFQKGRRWGWQKFVLQKQAFQPENGFLGEDLSITFEADVEVYGFIATTDQIPKTIQPKSVAQLDSLLSSSFVSLSSDFENTLTNGDAFSDTLIECYGETFHLHSQILATRSPVFARMLSGSFKERLLTNSAVNNANANALTTNVSDCSRYYENPQTKFKISITDIDAYVVKEMVRFIYTGKIDFDQSKKTIAPLSNSSIDLVFPQVSSPNTTASLDINCRNNDNEMIHDERLSKRRKSRAVKEFASKEDDNNIEEILNNENSFLPLTTSPNPDELLSPSPQPALTAITSSNSKVESDDEEKKDGLNSTKRKRDFSTSSFNNGNNVDDADETVNTFDLVAALMEAADKYEIDHLRKLCEAYLAQTVSPQTALNTLLLAERHYADELKHHALKYLGNITNLTSVRKHSPEAWQALDKTLANEILNYIITESSLSTDMITSGSDAHEMGLNRSVLVTTSPSVPTSVPSQQHHQQPPFSVVAQTSLIPNAVQGALPSNQNQSQNGSSAFTPSIVQFPQVFQQFSAAAPAGFFF